MIMKPINFVNSLELNQLEDWLKEHIHPYIIVEFIDDYVKIQLFSEDSMRGQMELALFNFPSDEWDTKYNSRAIGFNKENGVYTFTVFQNEMGFIYNKKYKVKY